MVSSKIKLQFWFLLFISPFALAQQSKANWQAVSEDQISNLIKETRNSQPLEYSLYSVDKNSFINELNKAPSRKSGLLSTVKITIPVAHFGMQEFQVYENSVFAPELQLNYPNIKSFTAQGIDDPSAIATITSSKIGVHIMVTSSNHKTTYVDPYTKNENFYISYSRESLPRSPFGFECHVEEAFNTVQSKTAIKNADDGLLRTYRLALVCTGEYADFHINDQGVSPSASDAVKKEAVLIAMNVSMARVNSVFERDVALRMELVPNNDDIIFLDAATDGLTNNNPFALLDQCQAICDAIIGDANYDIGHVFSTEGGGVAALNSPCNSGVKGLGVTGISPPINDPFNIDYVAHEMGHQYGANHPQNNNCNRSQASIEPGSASSIMGYAGICPPNIQNNSDDYFNGFSIIEMWTGINNNDCAATSLTNNEPPVVDAGPNYTIPHSTPFILRGNATDPNTGNELSYCWEQMDTTPANMPPQSNSSAGPLFRTLDPVNDSERFMPTFNTVLNNQLGTTWERLPGVARSMNFRLTVRDNVAGGGASDSDLTVVNTTSNGPFEVTSQTSGTAWGHQENYSVTWNVAESNIAPVNAPNVDILLSVDGGQNFDIILASGVTNDGEHVVISPSIDTNEARIMVRGTNHIFYDVNSTNFVIDGSILAIEPFNINNITVWPNPSKGNYTISFTTSSTSPILIKLIDLHGREITTNRFESNGSIFKQTVDYSSIANGLYFLDITQDTNSLIKQIIKN